MNEKEVICIDDEEEVFDTTTKRQQSISSFVVRVKRNAKKKRDANNEGKAHMVVASSVIDVDDDESTTPPPSSSSSSRRTVNQSQPTTTTIHICDHQVHFPCTPYESQVLFMTKIIETLSHEIGTSKHALLESPTGTGKSLSLLCSTLSWQESFKAKKIQEWKEWYDNTGSVHSVGVSNVGSIFEAIPSISSNKRKLRVVSDSSSSSSQHQTNKIIEQPMKKLKYNENDEIVLGGESLPLPIDVAQTKSGQDKAKNAEMNAQKIEASSIISLMRRGFHHKAEQQILQSSIFNTGRKKGDSKSSVVPIIYFASRTHSQIKQVVRELKKTPYQPDMVVLGSRDQYCIHSEVRKSNKKNEDCMKLVETSNCRYYRNHEGLAEDSALLADGPLHIFDIEDLVELGTQKKACPYFASHDILERAELVFCPYNYLIEPIIREAMGIELQNSIIVLDEAHNIEDVCRDAASATIRMDDILDAIEEFKILLGAKIRVDIHSNMITLLNKLVSWISACESRMVASQPDTQVHILRSKGLLIDMFRQLGMSEEVQNKTDVPFCKSGLYLCFLQVLQYANIPKTKKDDPHVLSAKTQIMLENIFYTFEFMLRGNMKYLSDYVVTTMKKQNKFRTGAKSASRYSKSRITTEWEVSINFWCMNPAVAFEDLKTKCHSVLLTSGTLSPLSSFSSELDTPFSTIYEAPHVVDLNRQVWVGQISTGPDNTRMNASYSEASSVRFQDSLGKLIYDYCSAVQYGVLLFFPSYNLMDKLAERWEKTGMMKKIKLIKKVFSEPRANNDKSKESSFSVQMDNFYECVERDGALFLAVCRGKVSEGIDLKDNYCRAVLVVGIPFPNVKDPIVAEKRRYNDEQMRQRPNRINGQTWYTQQAYRAVNQAIGRCLRHKYDYGAIVLIDERYREQSSINNLSKWVKCSVKRFDSHADSLLSLKQFFQDIMDDPILPPSTVNTIIPELVDSNVEDNDCPPTQLVHNNDLICQSRAGMLIPTQLIEPSIKAIKKETNSDPFQPPVIIQESQCTLSQTLKKDSHMNSFLRCISCDMIIVQQKPEYAQHELKLRRDLLFPYLQRIRVAISRTTVPTDFKLFQIPATMKNRPCPFKVIVTNVVSSTFIDQMALAQDIVVINGVTIETFSRANIVHNNTNCTVRSGWSDDDGMTYELLFCRSCKKNIVGAFVKSTDAAHMNHINELFIFPERVIIESGSPVSLTDESQASFSQMIVPVSFNT